MPKKRMVAMNVISVDVSATGTGIPKRRIV